MLEQVSKLIADPELTVIEQIQPLWSNFGVLARCYSPILNKNVIVKYVQPPNLESNQHPRGWNTTTSHIRKIKSYQVETHFYQHYAKETDLCCIVPQCIAYAPNDNQFILVLDDLHELGFTEHREEGNEFIVKKGIDWLAHFHAKFMGSQASGLWQQGGYWHLSTRQDELQKMADGELKNSASLIDSKLNQAKFQTLLHGDAKLQNMCFKPETAKVAAIDFQYVGKGAGVLDLMYFLGSAFEQDDLYKYSESLFEYYLTRLESALKEYRVNINFAELRHEYRELFPFAWADFYRFLLGWNPDSWKVNDFINDMAAQALSNLKGSDQ